MWGLWSMRLLASVAEVARKTSNCEQRLCDYVGLPWHSCPVIHDFLAHPVAASPWESATMKYKFEDTIEKLPQVTWKLVTIVWKTKNRILSKKSYIYTHVYIARRQGSGRGGRKQSTNKWGLKEVLLRVLGTRHSVWVIFEFILKTLWSC